MRAVSAISYRTLIVHQPTVYQPLARSQRASAAGDGAGTGWGPRLLIRNGPEGGPDAAAAAGRAQPVVDDAVDAGGGGGGRAGVDEAGAAGAVEAARRVDAGGVRVAVVGARVALVDGDAEEAVARVARLAAAREGPRQVGAEGVRVAGVGLERALVHVGTGGATVGGGGRLEAGLAGALGGVGCAVGCHGRWTRLQGAAGCENRCGIQGDRAVYACRC